MATRHVTALVCIRCEARFAPEEASLTCPACAEAGILDVEYDLDRVRQEMTAEHLGGRPRNHWRYMELLPVDPDNLPPLDVGGTPVYEVPRLGEVLGIDHLLIKDEGKNPTASFKDRASSVGVARALQQSRLG